MVSKIHPIKWRFHHSEENERFVIPRIQRAYAWEDKHVDAFLDDLHHAQQHGEEHYFGAFCTSAKGDQTILIDGQQRFTTVYMFLRCAKEFADASTMHDIDKFVTKDRLTLGRIDNDEFQRMPPGSAGTNSRSKLSSAYKRIREFVVKNKNTVNALVKTLLYKFLLVRIEFPSTYIGNAFALINNRGKTLTQVELIKSHLFVNMELTEKSEKVLIDYDEKWKKIVAEMDWSQKDTSVPLYGIGAQTRGTRPAAMAVDDEMHIFIQHALSLTEGDTKKTKIYKVFQERLRDIKNDDPESSADKKWLDEILEWSEVYGKLRRPRELGSGDGSQDVAKHREMCVAYLDRIRQLRAMSIYPILMAAYRRYFEKSSRSDFYEVVDACYRFHLEVMTLRKASEDNYRKKVQNMARDIYVNGDSLNTVISKIKGAKDDLCRYTPQLEDVLVEKRSNMASKHCLLLIEEKKCGKIITGKKPTLEHILPKKYMNDVQWARYVRKHYPESENGQRMNALIDDLGNQTLLDGSMNTKLRNGFFKSKFKEYGSEFCITRELKGMTNWLPGDIERRRGEYLKYLEKALLPPSPAQARRPPPRPRTRRYGAV